MVNFHKLEVTFDSRFSDHLKEHFRKVKNTLSGSEEYPTKLKFIYRIARILYINHFISKRDYVKIKQEIDTILESPSIKWLR